MHNHVARIINDGDADQTRDSRIAVINRERFHANCKQRNAINRSDRYRFIFVAPVYTSLSLANLQAVTVDYRPAWKISRVTVFEHAKINETFPTLYASLWYRRKYILTVNISVIVRSSRKRSQTVRDDWESVSFSRFIRHKLYSKWLLSRLINKKGALTKRVICIRVICKTRPEQVDNY